MYKQLSKIALDLRATDDMELQEAFWSVRSATSALINYDKPHGTALPVIDDCIVPTNKLGEFIGLINEFAAKHKLSLPIWGHAGDAHLHVMPILDLAKLGDRQKVFKLMHEYFTAVVALGGSIAAENNDGRLRAAFTQMQLGEELSDVQVEIKKAFDQYGMLNPGVKTGTSLKQVVDLLRDDYSVTRHADYLPRL
jgi:FAD/FMN-containing dehydrogenase